MNSGGATLCEGEALTGMEIWMAHYTGVLYTDGACYGNDPRE